MIETPAEHSDPGPIDDDGDQSGVRDAGDALEDETQVNRIIEI